jgi:diguanylate cyclase (GGDEF)-like protein
MKKIRLSLFNIITSLSVISISFVIFIAMEESYTTNKNFYKEIDNHVQMGVLGVREIISNHFSRIYDVFNKTINIDIERLKEVQEYFDDVYDDLEPIVKLLNKESVFGSYDVYLFDKERQIYRTSLKNINRDNIYDILKNNTFDRLSSGGLNIEISAPAYSIISNDFRRYLFTESKSRDFFIQISHNYNFVPSLKKEMKAFIDNFEDIYSVDMYILSKDKVRAVFDQSTKLLNHNSLIKNISRDLKLKDSNLSSIIKEIKNPKYSVDLGLKTATLYTILNITLNPKRNDLVILKVKYDLGRFVVTYHKESSRLWIMIVLSLLLVVGIMSVIKSLVIDNIYRVIKALNGTQPIDTRGIKVKEFEILTLTLEKYREKLNRRNKELESLASIDNMTGCLNRRVFNEKLDEYFYQYERYGRRFGLIIFDIDNFKKINDNYGHRRGDIILIELSARIQKHMRKSDLFFRIGGEEFAILVLSDNEKGVLEFAKKIRKTVEDKPFDRDLKVTISVGVGVINGDKDSISLFNRIDRYTYISKKNGKNRVTSIFDQMTKNIDIKK